MIRMPATGFRRSINEHNCKLDILCDWIEGSILFIDDEISITDVIDILIEEQIYDDQDFAYEIVNSAWGELSRRAVWVNAEIPYIFDHRRITRQISWQDTPAFSFCLLLSLANWYSEWARQFGSDYTEQGLLFEQLTAESIKRQFYGWDVHQTGWSRLHPNRMEQVVDEVAGILGELKGDIALWTEPDAREKGLDLLCYKPFSDQRVGLPTYLIQCASGGDWEKKTHTPELSVWCKVINFTVRPTKGFSTPLALLDNDFRIHCNRVEGLFLDRIRILSAAQYEQQWVDRQLRDRIIAWADPRVRVLPTY